MKPYIPSDGVLIRVNKSRCQNSGKTEEGIELPCVGSLAALVTWIPTEFRSHTNWWHYLQVEWPSSPHECLGSSSAWAVRGPGAESYHQRVAWRLAWRWASCICCRKSTRTGGRSCTSGAINL